MSNRLPIEVISKIRALRSSGLSMRAVAREVGISRNTIANYMSADDGALCACGDPAGHLGWCRVRYSKSVKYQGRHAARTGMFIAPPPEEKRSRAKSSVLEKRKWLGKDRHIGAKLPRDEWYGAIGEVHAATKSVPRESRDDVRQEMITAAMEGRLPRADIRRAVSTFITHFSTIVPGWFQIIMSDEVLAIVETQQSFIEAR